MRNILGDGMNQNNIICFYHENEEFGCFSNWYMISFKYAGKIYNSVEQYMMCQKANLFREYELADRIMESNDPAEIKKLGRTKMARFNAELWDKVSYAIVKRGVRAKFEQNRDICKILLDTGNKLLAEASLKDFKWGIGVSITDMQRYDTKEWHGKNLLGQILMEVRDELNVAMVKGELGYVDAHDLTFKEWDLTAGILERIPKFHDTIHAYSDTLRDSHDRNCFYNDATLAEWEMAMRVNMGGGLPASGFWEMKQDIYDLTQKY